MKTLDDLDRQHVNDSGVCGAWSAKDVVGHIGASEGALGEVLNTVLGIEVPMPFMEVIMTQGLAGFNDVEAAKRKETPYEEVLREYIDYYEKNMDLLALIPEETFRIDGLLAWYGAQYDLEDFLVYSFYAHKREHGAQINELKYRLSIA